jgi:hypothetical protein
VIERQQKNDEQQEGLYKIDLSRHAHILYRSIAIDVDYVFNRLDTYSLSLMSFILCPSLLAPPTRP